MSIYENFIKNQENDFYLRSTTYLMQIGSKEFREELTKLYNTGDLQMMTIATILNAIYTDGKPTFFMSARILDSLLEGDKNLAYKGRRGIKSTEYRQAYSLMKAYFNTADAFDLVSDSSKDTKAPMCVALVDEMTMRSMGDQMTVKLASNWHQMAIKTIQALNTKEVSGKSIHDTVIDTVTVTSSVNLKGKKSIDSYNSDYHSAALRAEQEREFNSHKNSHPIQSTDHKIDPRDSLDILYRKWTRSIPEKQKFDFTKRRSYLNLFLESVKDEGYSLDDLTTSIKKKVTSYLYTEKKGRDQTQEKYDNWIAMVEADYESELNAVFLEPIRAKTEDELNEEDFWRSVKSVTKKNPWLFDKG